MRERSPLIDYALLGLLSLLWGGSFTLIKIAVADYPPATLAALRMAIGGAALLVLARAQGLRLPRSGRRWAELLLQGLLQGALPFSLISWGEMHMASGLAGVINSTVPMFVFLISVFAVRSARFAMLKFIGVLLGLTGVATLAGAQSLTQLSSTAALPVLAVLAASASYACGALFGHRFGDQPAIVTASGSLLCGSAVMLALSACLDAPWALRPSLHATLALLGLALLSTALASVIFFRLIKTLGSLATTSNAYLRALVSVLLGAVFLGEPVGWPLVAAIALIFTGVALVTRSNA
jgi:drug/metabolite transporter (DMT)-like permease